MRIIRKGVIESEQEIEITCKHCNTLFAYKLGETQMWSSTDDTIIYRGVRCPVCSNGVSVGIKSSEYNTLS